MEYYHVENNNKNKTLKNCVYFQIIGETKKCYKIEINGIDKRRIRMTTLNKIEYTIESFKPQEQNEIKNEIKNEIEKLKSDIEIEIQYDGFIEKNILSNEMKNDFSNSFDGFCLDNYLPKKKIEPKPIIEKIRSPTDGLNIPSFILSEKGLDINVIDNIMSYYDVFIPPKLKNSKDEDFDVHKIKKYITKTNYILERKYTYEDGIHRMGKQSLVDKSIDYFITINLSKNMICDAIKDELEIDYEYKYNDIIIKGFGTIINKDKKIIRISHKNQYNKYNDFNFHIDKFESIKLIEIYNHYIDKSAEKYYD
jgi:hypothetical protein